jgi:glycosyltransferase involved in cell wall biosynthesis
VKIWILTNMPAPYQVEFFNALGRSGCAEVSVRHLCADRPIGSWWPPREPAFAHRSFRSLTPRGWRLELQFHPGIVWECLRGRYDFYILSGQYTSPTFLACAVVLWLLRRRWAIWAERPFRQRHELTGSTRVVMPSRLVQRVRTSLLSALVRMAPRIFCIGTVAMESYAALGAKPEKLVLLPYMCDLARYRDVASQTIAETRRQLGLKGKFVFLFSGQMIVRKGVDLLLTAFSSLARERNDVALVLLGDGPLRSAWEAGIEPSIRGRVCFVGHVDQAELPRYFLAADALVFPSRYDGWAVVVNEGCAAALPIITTSSVGASRDLVVDGSNGYIAPADDAACLAQRMRWLAENPETAKQWGVRSRELVEQFSPENGVRQLLAAVADGSCGQFSSKTSPECNRG